MSEAKQKITNLPMSDADGIAHRCHCSKRHLFRLVERGLMPPPVMLGTLARWPLAVIDEWIDAGCPPVEHPDSEGDAR